MPHRNHFNTSFVLSKVLKVIKPLVSWLLKSGIGYSEFSQSLKNIFYLEAEKELARLNQKKTSSSLSLLSGLNRREVNTYKDICVDSHTSNLVSVPSRVITLWINKKWDRQIAFNTGEINFECLTKEVSQDIHPRSILMELQRLGLVSVFDNTVLLHSTSFTPSNDKSEQQKLLSQSGYDHLAAGLGNIFISKNQFLEQNFHADELTAESIHELKSYSTELWKEYSEKLLDRINVCSERDQGKVDANYRFSLGIYQFDEKEEV